MSYLRFIPAEYETIARCSREHDLAARNQPTFKRLLIQALREVRPELAVRIAGLGRKRMDVLYGHFRFGPRPAADAPAPAVDVEQRFTPGEIQTLAEACGAAASPVRFVRPFRRVLVELFEEVSPRLARKLNRLSSREWEGLYEQVRALRRRP